MTKKETAENSGQFEPFENNSSGVQHDVNPKGATEQSFDLKGSVKVDGAILDYIVEGEGSPIIVIGSANYYSRTFSAKLRERFQMAFADLRHFARQSPGYR